MPGTDRFQDRSPLGGGVPAGMAKSSSSQRLERLLGRRFTRFMDEAEPQDKDEGDVYRSQGVDQVFSFERWQNHRNTSRYGKHLLYMFSSRVFRSLMKPVLAVMLIALFVGLYETLLKAGVLPHTFPHVTLAMGQAFNITAFALSLLLVFRTNSSYDRWWEARKLWGGVVNRSRDVVRQGLVFFQEEDVVLKQLLCRWTVAFSRTLMCHLRENGDVQKQLQGILSPEELTLLCAAGHRPNCVLQVMTEIIKLASLEFLPRLRMDDNLTFFEDAMGSCERILRTPIPLSYTRHTSRFLLVWLMIMPFTLWAAYGWTSVLMSGIFAFLMLGIDEIGVQIEEPFGVLPLESICATIERNVRELLARNEEVHRLVTTENSTGTAAIAAAVGDGAAHRAQSDDFGELTGATPAGNEANPAVVNLTATEAERHVQFGPTTYIELPAAGGAQSGPAASSVQIDLGTLAGRGSPRSSPKAAHRFRGWLDD